MSASSTAYGARPVEACGANRKVGLVFTVVFAEGLKIQSEAASVVRSIRVIVFIIFLSNVDIEIVAASPKSCYAPIGFLYADLVAEKRER
jgi:hypothetical protein